ncbi:MAG TPA: hypothetical protein PLR99_14960 [Polyangiaceae bacterium]|nr:hypothetical protein [Polyangiaceae bacterium]
MNFGSLHRRSAAPVALCLALALVAACSSSTTPSDAGAASGSGTAQLIVVPEESIPEGLKAGDGPENLKDGWTITYDRFLVTIGGVVARRSDDGASTTAPDVFVLDLRNAPTTGYVLAEWKGLGAARYDKFSFSLPNAKPGAKLLAPTRQADLDLMTKEGFSVYFEGAATKGAEKLTFKWGFRAGTTFADCATSDGQAGFAVPSGGTVQVKPTIHGDHWFFTNVTQGAELTERRAEWIKTCDKNGDKDVTLDELKACDLASAMPQKPNGPYDLTGVKDQDGDPKLSVYDYVASQARTLGDFQGDGECPTRSPSP